MDATPKKILADMTTEELQNVLCVECGVENMAESACRMHMGCDEAVCSGCCEDGGGCGECGDGRCDDPDEGD